MTDQAERAPWSPAHWESFLEDHFDFPIKVVYSRSRSAPVQARALRLPAAQAKRTRSAEGWEIRLHQRFQEAPTEVRQALATWLRAGRRATKAGPILDAWIHAEIASLPAQERKITLDSGGLTHPLGKIASHLFETEFANDFAPAADRERPRISWGRRGKSRSRRSLRLGSFEPTARIVRVHPVLDQPAVPEWFVRFVLKHEILHACIDTYRDPSGRWVHHGPEFRRREHSWPEYEAAMLWEHHNLARIIRSAREGSQLRVRAEDLIDPAPVGLTQLDVTPEPAPEPAPERAPERAPEPRELAQPAEETCPTQGWLPFE